MQVYILLLFGVVFVGDGEKIGPALIEGCGGDPPHTWNRHICSQELVHQEASEDF